MLKQCMSGQGNQGCSSVAVYYILYRSNLAGKELGPNPGFIQVSVYSFK